MKLNTFLIYASIGLVLLMSICSVVETYSYSITSRTSNKALIRNLVKRLENEAENGI